MDVLLYAWTGPETPVAKATIISVDPDTIVGGETLGPGTYEVLVNVAIRRDATVPYEYDGLQIIADAVTKLVGKKDTIAQLVGKASGQGNRKSVGKDYTIKQSVRKTSTAALTENRSANMLPSGSRSGKIPSRAIRRPVGNSLYRRPTVGWERYVGRENAFPSGFSPTNNVGRQYSFPTECMSSDLVFPTNLFVRDVVLWCSVSSILYSLLLSSSSYMY